MSTATPSGGRACTNSALAAAMFSCEPSSPRCAVPTLITTPISGFATAASCAISPRALMAISSTMAWC